MCQVQNYKERMETKINDNWNELVDDAVVKGTIEQQQWEHRTKGTVSEDVHCESIGICAGDMPKTQILRWQADGQAAQMTKCVIGKEKMRNRQEKARKDARNRSKSRIA